MRKRTVSLVFLFFTVYLHSQCTNLVLKHHLEDIFSPTADLYCNTAGANIETGYFRIFDLSDYDIDQNFIAKRVTFGVALSDANGTEESQPATINLYSFLGDYDDPRLADMGLIYSQEIEIVDVREAFLTFELNEPVAIPAGTFLAVELYIPGTSRDIRNLFRGT